MSAAGTRHPRPERQSGGLLVRQTAALARRSLVDLRRQPQIVVSALVFPTFFIAINSLALGRSTELTGFPETSSYVAFLLPGTIVQAVLFGATSAGTDMAIDIEGGFFDRLLLSPARRVSIVLGRLAGAALLGAAIALVYMVGVRPFGAEVASGAAGVVALIAIGAMLGVAFGGLAVAIAVRTGSAEAVNAAFPVFFALMFMSSSFFPTNLMTGWFAVVAKVNPVTVVVDSSRRLVLEPADLAAILTALGTALVPAAVVIGLCVRALTHRVDTT